MNPRRIGIMVAASMVVVITAGCFSIPAAAEEENDILGRGRDVCHRQHVGIQAGDRYHQQIDILHTGSGASCSVFTGPLTLDIANLAGVMQLINVTSCPRSRTTGSTSSSQKASH